MVECLRPKEGWLFGSGGGAEGVSFIESHYIFRFTYEADSKIFHPVRVLANATPNLFVALSVANDGCAR
jgi:hypothetical protein